MLTILVLFYLTETEHCCVRRLIYNDIYTFKEMLFMKVHIYFFLISELMLLKHDCRKTKKSFELEYIRLRMKQFIFNFTFALRQIYV